MSAYADALVAGLRAGLSAHADPARAAAGQRYLKTTMPMWGVPRPVQKQVFRGLAASPPPDAAAWEAAVRLAWEGPEREMKWAAVAMTHAWRGRFLVPACLPLLEQLARDGAWWDLVDELAAHAVGTVLLRACDHRRPTLLRWIADPDLWVRRTAILAQLRHRGDTDVDLLFDLCRRQAADTSFWIRKAIGWALRQHARTDAAAVRAFLDAHGAALSGLSRREASKHLG